MSTSSPATLRSLKVDALRVRLEAQVDPVLSFRRAGGLHPYCITIDNTAMEHLPHMYGPAAYTVVDQVHKPPHRVANIYRRLSVRTGATCRAPIPWGDSALRPTPFPVSAGNTIRCATDLRRRASK